MTRTKQDQELGREGEKPGLEINEEKAKYTMMTRNERGKYERISNRSFEEVQKFKYLVSAIRKSN